MNHTVKSTALFKRTFKDKNESNVSLTLSKKANSSLNNENKCFEKFEIYCSDQVKALKDLLLCKIK